MTSISPISTHHYIPKLLGVGQIVEYTFPKPVKEAIQELEHSFKKNTKIVCRL